MYRVFIDGSAGTTGLRIHERLMNHPDISVVQLPESSRRDPECRRREMEGSDITFLCLPDETSREMAGAAGSRTRLIDTSTAFRTDPHWLYGFPELSTRLRSSLSKADRVSVPGCHATGYISLVFPLVKSGVLGSDALISCTSLTGYSGGGRQMIAECTADDRPDSLSGARIYAISQCHKHLPEMTRYSNLDHPPVFMPVIADCYAGMVTSVPLHLSQLNGIGTAHDLCRVYQDFYRDSATILVDHLDDSERMLPVNEMAGFDSMRLSVLGNDERMTVTASFDNLGKGSSGTAIQCMNLMLGLPETTGLRLMT